MPDDELLLLLEQSRSNNARLGITGMLLYHKQSFMQYLEGNKEAIFDLYDRKIYLDERHTAVTLFFEQPIEARSFAAWSMGFRNLDAVEPERLVGFTSFLEEGFTSELLTEQPTAALRILSQFRANDAGGLL